ncbi:MAG: T9SS type A sorting domain-containing protein [FCB group bacterium]|nr:T9SS type A sorting domain-containing protein [FCB group bacterium]
MNQIKIILFLGIIVSTTLLPGKEVPIVVDDALVLETYAGAESILLVWSQPSGIEPETVRIFRSDNLYDPFEILAEINDTGGRYLDTLVTADQRYFYRVELIGTNGITYTSSQKTPPFSRILLPEKDLPENRAYLRTVDNLEDFVVSTIVKNILSYDAGVDSAVAESVGRSLVGDTLQPYFWWRGVPLYEFSKCQFIARTDFVRSVSEELDYLLTATEPYLRNGFFLTPKEWQIWKKDLLDRFSIHWQELADDYSITSDFLDQSKPIQIVKQNVNEDTIRVDLLIVDPSRLDYNNLYLTNREEHLNLAVTADIQSGALIKVDIPKTWMIIDVVNGMDIVQSVPVMRRNGQLILSLENEYCFEDSAAVLPFEVSLPKEAAWLNEVVFSAETKTLAIEIVGVTDQLAQFGFFIGDSLLWDLTPELTFEESYLDSNWVVSVSDSGFFWVHLKKYTLDGGWKTLESRPIPAEYSIVEGRIPDKGPWQTIDNITLGKPNSTQKTTHEQLNVPDVFALYQNYPNPFNASTTITFDLIQPAIISLFVTDARGRIVQTFIDDSHMEAGTYHYTWFGENRSSGIYFFTLQAQVDNYLPVVFSRKMIYLK